MPPSPSRPRSDACLHREHVCSVKQQQVKHYFYVHMVRVNTTINTRIFDLHYARFSSVVAYVCITPLFLNSFLSMFTFLVPPSIP